MISKSFMYSWVFQKSIIANQLLQNIQENGVLLVFFFCDIFLPPSIYCILTMGQVRREDTQDIAVSKAKSYT